MLNPLRIISSSLRFRAIYFFSQRHHDKFLTNLTGRFSSVEVWLDSTMGGLGTIFNEVTHQGEHLVDSTMGVATGAFDALTAPFQRIWNVIMSPVTWAMVAIFLLVLMWIRYG